MAKIIALLPVRNEAWIIGRTLAALTAFCDHIIVADQSSTDGTLDILSTFPEKVTVINNPDIIWNERIREKLLDMARDFSGNNFIVCLYADELVSVNILDQNILDFLVNLKPGTGVILPFYKLWKSPYFYRDDASVWSNNFFGFGFRDDRLSKYSYTSIALHQNRFPPGIVTQPFSDLKLLHYQLVLFERKRSKECWYRTLETMQLGADRIAAINYYYRVARDERQVRLSPLDPEWIAGWRDLGLDLEHFEEEPLYWYDVEVLRYLHEKGAAYFAPLDIWDVDWEAKRQLALSRGFEGIPPEPVADPRSWEQKLYHAYLARFQGNPFWRDPCELARLTHRGLRRVAKGLGVQRRHLEHLGLLKPKEGGGGE